MKISMQVHCCHVSNEQSASISLGQHKGAGCQIHTNEEPLEALNDFFLCGGVHLGCERYDAVLAGQDAVMHALGCRAADCLPSNSDCMRTL